ncbi:Histone deacetylase clr3 [Penicillium macrosclerotiorum]|uniref:Histone deacetylase clr3 n=1 Tax=Penicillium macrosclerotiorum TaxID=303699 RepID=UPI0025480F1F|nr:Histone deacetylase clr3 [Penicillium macrosclerotiorum]KAJ5688810.1 Histone deacetylase clr3 [Penicillium macrosclerotiorum]
MEEDKDTIMGETRKIPSLSSHTSLTHPPPSAHLQQRANPTLTPSFIPGVNSSPSPGSEPFPPRDSTLLTGMAPPERVKLSDSDSNSASISFKRDSLVEPNSDWSDEEVMPRAGLPVGSLATGLCYDVRMRYHCEVRPTSDVHPEDPRRIYYIYKELCRAGLVDDPESTRPLAPQTLQRIHARNATEKEITHIHSQAHFAFVESTREMTDDELVYLEQTRDSIYFNRLTFASSLLSTGGAIETCLAVARREVKNAIAVIRPPGHHAEHDVAMGFCLFNNVPVAARVCQNELGDQCRKILILDWDVHHAAGNGIQKAFYNDPNILYISLHVHQNGRFYPGGQEGDWDHCGEGPGLGKNVNIPWPDQGMGDGDYMFAFQQVVMPIALEFNPDLVIISAGFDAAAGDVLGGCFVSPACYAQMTHMLMTLANGKVAVCLEGGYNFRSISKSALAVTKTLMGEPPDRLLMTSPTEDAVSTVRRVMGIQAQYWHCMFPKPPTHPVWADRLHDVLRDYQSKQLYASFKLTPLYIYRTAISKSFDNQVLASPNYNQPVPLVVIFHDPPEMVGHPHPVTNKLDAHNCWVADVQKEYIAWIINKGYAVIDINIPKHVSREPATGRYEEEDENRPTATEELASYLWDNYIEPNDHREIFFMGIGNAFYGAANLLINRENLYKHVNGIVSFVAENPVRAIASPTQTWLSKWYRDNSLVFVSKTHSVWGNPDRKPSKRYGRLHKSEKTSLSEMLSEHKAEVFEWLAERADEEPSEEEQGDADQDLPMKE